MSDVEEGGSSDQENAVEEASGPFASVPGLRELCKLHGINTEKSFLKKGKNLKTIDLFQVNAVDMRALAHFPAVEDAIFIQTSFSHLHSLGSCSQIVRLWLTECNLKSIPSLSGCDSLKVLNLSSNLLESLDGIETVPQLEELYVDENKLTSLAHIHHVKELRILNAARNKISTIGAYLDYNVKLQELNLADNRIGFFKEVLNLARLPNLRDLCLSDPHYGSNPVCNLCNYQTYALYQLPQLESLDTLKIRDEVKQNAEATFMKKKMYYNMRIKTLKRNTTNVIKRAKRALSARVSFILNDYSALRRRYKDVVREREEIFMAELGERPPETQQKLDELGGALEVLANAMEEKLDQIRRIKARFQHLRHQLLTISEENISRLIMELSTGGNIRMEDGRTSDMWYASCADLVYSRFYHRDFHRLGVRGVKVHRVTKLNNRLLRNRFDKRVAKILEGNPDVVLHPASPGTASSTTSTSSRGPRRALEYLFYPLPPSYFGESRGGDREITRFEYNPLTWRREVQALGEQGFTAAHATVKVDVPPLEDGYWENYGPRYHLLSKRFQSEDNGEAGRSVADGKALGIPLTNSLSSADFARIADALAYALEGTGKWKRPEGLQPRVEREQSSRSIGSSASELAVNGGSVRGAAPKAPQPSSTAPTVIPPSPTFAPSSNMLSGPETWMSQAGIDVQDSATEATMKQLTERDRALADDSGPPPPELCFPPEDDHFDQGIFDALFGFTGPILSEGMVLVCKTFLGRCATVDEQGNLVLPPAKKKKKGKKSKASRDGDSSPPPEEPEPTEDQGTIVDPQDCPEVHSVLRSRPDDPRQKQWVALDPDLVLPEYLVEYQYEWRLPNASTDTKPVQYSSSATISQELAALVDLVSGSTPEGGYLGAEEKAIDAQSLRLTAQEEADLRPLVRPLATFVAECREAMTYSGWSSESTAGGGVPIRSRMKETLAQVPSMRPRGKLTELSVATVIEQGLTFEPTIRTNPEGVPGVNMSVPDVPDLPSIEPYTPSPEEKDQLLRIRYLNLHANQLKELGPISLCRNLQVLVLSFNELTSLDGLYTLNSLRRLDLSHNHLQELDHFGGLVAPDLKVIDLSYNRLNNLQTLQCLSDAASCLDELDVRGNPFCETANYRIRVLNHMPKLKLLDDVEVSAEESEKAYGVASSVTLDLLKAHCYDAGGNLLFRSKREKAADAANGGGEDAVEEARWNEVRAINLSHLHLTSLACMDKVPMVTSANFAANELTSIDDFAGLTRLEELCVEENRVSNIDKLSACTNLTRLEVGKNQIESIGNLQPLPRLTQLSIEDNRLSTLSDVAKFTSLLELYIGNNNLTQIKEIMLLKALPKLIILDLSGNPLCSAKNYRLYTIYHLRRLKVLDGVGVDAEEQAASREKYSGRLTAEFLEDKMGKKLSESIRELDLASCRIKEIEPLSPVTFRCLSFLNLDHNNLTGRGLAGLRNLPHLSVIRLNHNKITSLVPALIPQGDEDVSSPASPTSPSSPKSPSLPIPLPTQRWFAQLEVLQLGYNQISDMEQLALDRLPELKVLYLQGNDIQRISGLQSCSALRELVLDKNRIKYVEASAFDGTTSLRELRIQENGLRSLSNFHTLQSLQVLNLGYNRISDPQEVDKLNSLPYLSEMWLSNNPLARKQLYRPTIIRKLPTLTVLDGREIVPEDRERAEMIFNGDTRGQVFVQDPRYASLQQMPLQPVGGRIPVKLTAVNFESFTGYRPPAIPRAPEGPSRSGVSGVSVVNLGIGGSAIGPSPTSGISPRMLPGGGAVAGGRQSLAQYGSFSGGMGVGSIFPEKDSGRLGVRRQSGRSD